MSIPTQFPSTMTNTLQGSGLSSSPRTTGAPAEDSQSWFEAMAKAWGRTLDSQASRLTELSGEIAGGNDQPSSIQMLTAESLRMQFLSNNAATSQNSVGQALETLGKRQ